MRLPLTSATVVITVRQHTTIAGGMFDIAVPERCLVSPSFPDIVFQVSCQVRGIGSRGMPLPSFSLLDMVL